MVTEEDTSDTQPLWKHVPGFEEELAGFKSPPHQCLHSCQRQDQMQPMWSPGSQCSQVSEGV